MRIALFLVFALWVPALFWIATRFVAPLVAARSWRSRHVVAADLRRADAVLVRALPRDVRDRGAAQAPRETDSRAGSSRRARAEASRCSRRSPGSISSRGSRARWRASPREGAEAVRQRRRTRREGAASYPLVVTILLAAFVAALLTQVWALGAASAASPARSSTSCCPGRSSPRSWRAARGRVPRARRRAVPDAARSRRAVPGRCRRSARRLRRALRLRRRARVPRRRRADLPGRRLALATTASSRPPSGPRRAPCLSSCSRCCRRSGRVARRSAALAIAGVLLAAVVVLSVRSDEVFQWIEAGHHHLRPRGVRRCGAAAGNRPQRRARRRRDDPARGRRARQPRAVSVLGPRLLLLLRSTARPRRGGPGRVRRRAASRAAEMGVVSSRHRRRHARGPVHERRPKLRRNVLARECRRARCASPRPRPPVEAARRRAVARARQRGWAWAGRTRRSRVPIRPQNPSAHDIRLFDGDFEAARARVPTVSSARSRQYPSPRSPSTAGPGLRAARREVLEGSDRGIPTSR